MESCLGDLRPECVQAMERSVGKDGPMKGRNTGAGGSGIHSTVGGIYKPLHLSRGRKGKISGQQCHRGQKFWQPGLVAQVFSVKWLVMPSTKEDVED